MTTSNMDIVFVVHKTSMHWSTQFKQAINLKKKFMFKLLVLKISRFSKYGWPCITIQMKLSQMLPPIMLFSLHNVNGSIVSCYVKLIVVMIETTLNVI
jgi:hypothetical protein